MLGFPVVIKPASQGSAVGVSIVSNKAGLEKALKEAGRHAPEVIAERYISGRELTVSILDSTALPVIEIIPKKGFYDYKAKYTKGLTDFVVPAVITKAVEKKAVAESLRAYGLLGCSGAARVDVMLDENGAHHTGAHGAEPLSEGGPGGGARLSRPRRADAQGRGTRQALRRTGKG